MQSLRGSLIRRQTLDGLNIIAHFKSTRGYLASNCSKNHQFSSLICESSVSNGFFASNNPLLRPFHHFASRSPLPLTKFGSQAEILRLSDIYGQSPRLIWSGRAAVGPLFSSRSMTTAGDSVRLASQDYAATVTSIPPRIKFKRLDKTAKHIMNILDKEAVEEVRTQREIPDIKPGYIVQLKVEVPENKRRLSILKGVVIARRNAGLNTTFRLRRQVAGVGVESLFPLYSPNIKEIKVLDKKKVRRAKLYYLRDKMNALKKS